MTTPLDPTNTSPLTPIPIFPPSEPQKTTIEHFVKTSSLFTQVKKLDEAIATLTHVQNDPTIPEKLIHLDELFKKGSLFESDLKDDKDLPHLVVLAYKDGLISELQLGTYFFHQSALHTYPDLERIPIFLNGEINPKAAQIFYQMNQLQYPHVLTDQQFPDWIDKMRSLPPSEQYFLTYLPPSDKNNVTILDAIAHISGHPFFVEYPIEAERWRIFPSIGMVDSLFEPHFAAIPASLGGARQKASLMDGFLWDGCMAPAGGPSEGKLSCPAQQSLRKTNLDPSGARGVQTLGRNVTPRVRFAARKDISDNGLKGERDIVVRNPYQLTPATADSYSAPGPEYTSHDLCYHALLVNYVPLEQQQLFIELDQSLKQALSESDELGDLLVMRLYDMDVPSYKLIKNPHNINDQVTAFIKALDADCRFIAYHQREPTQELPYLMGSLLIALLTQKNSLPHHLSFQLS